MDILGFIFIVRFIWQGPEISFFWVLLQCNKRLLSVELSHNVTALLLMFSVDNEQRKSMQSSNSTAAILWNYRSVREVL